MIIIRVLSVKHKFWAHKRNVSKGRFFYTSKTYAIMNSYWNRTWICHILWIQCVPNFCWISEYFMKIEVRIFEVLLWSFLPWLTFMKDFYRNTYNILSHLSDLYSQFLCHIGRPDEYTDPRWYTGIHHWHMGHQGLLQLKYLFLNEN